MDEKQAKLTAFSRFAGCGAKVSPSLLDKALCGLRQPLYPDLISDFSHAEDCGVYRLSDDTALVQTIDFFPPVCDDPWMFGRIAAANALSDVYAMGATPLMAVSVVCFPDEKLDITYLRLILEGALDALAEAGAPLVGGHTVRDDELKFGLCINGTVNPKRVLKNNSWKSGEALILTKPIGVGILNTAARAHIASEEEERKALESMRQLNKVSAQVLSEFPVSACTDVTGYGLLGHAWEMTVDNEVGAVIESAMVPLFSHVCDYAAMGLIPAGAYQNRESRARFVTGFDQLDETMGFVLFDPQTSGGLLASVPRHLAASLLSALHDRGVTGAVVGYTDEKLSGLHVR